MLNTGSRANRNGKIIAFVLLAAVLFVVSFSSFYVISQSNHTCQGESCSVCSVICQCEDTIKAFGNAVALAAVILSAVFSTLLVLLNSCLMPMADTLISYKVRLNN